MYFTTSYSDKILRSKSKHKYQQFLEEQQRRNERNKQLVQMLERIEQQTAAMNARSERLKMMKVTNIILAHLKFQQRT